MLQLAWPIVLAELGWTMMGIVDIVVVGRLPASADAIAAVSLGSILFYVVAIFGAGLLLGLDTLVSQAFGAGSREDCHRSLINALYLTLPLGIILMATLWGILPLLKRMGERPEVLTLLNPYLATLTWSVFPLLLYFALRRYLQSVNVVRPVMFALISANLINLAGNVILVFGHLGMPALGVKGSAYATVLSRVYMTVVLVLALIWSEKPGLHWPLAIDWERMRVILRLGLPAGMQILLEIGMFAVTAALLGRIDSVSLAAHQIALNAASVTFMVTLAIGSAAAVRVGQALGRNDRAAAATAGWTAFGIGVAFMACAAVMFWTVPAYLAAMFTPDPAVIRLSVSLLVVAGFFQIFDGAQIVLAGALRGAGDTQSPMYCHFFGYWVVGLPLGYWLCFGLGWGPVGMWIGLCAALMLIGSILAGLWWAKVRSWHIDPGAQTAPSLLKN